MDYLADYAFESMEMADSTVIPEGSRNSSLSHFVELKADGKKIRPLQVRRKRQLEALGFSGTA